MQPSHIHAKREDKATTNNSIFHVETSSHYNLNVLDGKGDTNLHTQENPLIAKWLGVYLSTETTNN